MEWTPYPSDVTDGQWQIITPLIPLAQPGGSSPIGEHAGGGQRDPLPESVGLFVADAAS